MTMTQNTDGGGGGGTQPFCAISPSDLVGIENNFLSRIETLEKAVSALLGVNVTANQLSDLSQQIGTVEGITYMGVPGWTMTEAGTLIPPTGFSLSSSGFQMFNACTGQYENYQGVSVDSDGVLQFGFSPNGGVCGDQVQGWNAVAQSDYALLGYSPTTTASVRDISQGIDIISHTLVGTGGAAAILQVTKDGVYLCSANIKESFSVGVSDYLSDMAYATINVLIGSEFAPKEVAHGQGAIVISQAVRTLATGSNTITLPADTDGFTSAYVSALVPLSAGDKITFDAGDIFGTTNQGLSHAAPNQIHTFYALRVSGNGGLTLVSAEVGNIDDHTIVAKFSTKLVSSIADYKSGFSVKVVGVVVTISDAQLQSDNKTIRFTVPTILNTDSVEIAYDATLGSIRDVSSLTAMPSIPYTPVKNNIP